MKKLNFFKKWNVIHKAKKEKIKKIIIKTNMMEFNIKKR
jgi:hypothetical protein